MKKVLLPVQPEIAKHPLWVELRRWLQLSIGAQNQHRFTFRSDTPSKLIDEASNIWCTDCKCGNRFRPIRKASNWSSYSLHVTGISANGHQGCFSGHFSQSRVLWLQMDLGRAESAPRTIKARIAIEQERTLFD